MDEKTQKNFQAAFGGMGNHLCSTGFRILFVVQFFHWNKEFQKFSLGGFAPQTTHFENFIFYLFFWGWGEIMGGGARRKIMFQTP